MPNCSWSFTIARALVVMLVSATSIVAEPVDRPSVRVRVNDYASVAVDLLARAQDEVKQLYARIGVETTWLATRRLSDRDDLSHSEDANATELTVIVLSSSMTTRMAPPEDAIGMAATTPTDNGRIAYVFYDRLQIDPLQSDDSNVAALAFVMAHEIGHLLLPYGSHSETGVMRGRWDRKTFRRLEVQRLRFTPLQGRQIRHLLDFAW
jgi:hypothetical protein